MRNKLVRLLPRTAYDFTPLAKTTSLTNIALALNVDVSRWGAGTLLIRLHAINMSSPLSSFRVDAVDVAPTDQDPSVFFQNGTVGSATIPGSAVSPALYRARLAPDSAAFISVYLSVFQQGSGALSFTISIDLLLHEGLGWTPADLGSQLTLWLDQRDQVVVSDRYSGWGDESLTLNTFNQTTAGNRPVVGSRINGFAAPSFDGTADFMISNNLSSFVAATGYHVFAVFAAVAIAGVNPTVYLNDGVIADGNAGWWGLYLKLNGTTAEVHGFHWDNTLGACDANAGGLSLGTNSLVEWSYDGSLIRCQVGANVVATASSPNGIGSLANPVNVGTGAATSKLLNGPIASIIVCNSHLQPTDVTNIRDYLSSKYWVQA